MHLSQLPSQLSNSLALCAKKKSKNKIYIRCLRKERQMCREKKWWHTHARTLFPFPLICRTISGSSLLQPPNKRRGSLVPKGPQQTCRPKKKKKHKVKQDHQINMRHPLQSLFIDTTSGLWIHNPWNSKKRKGSLQIDKRECTGNTTGLPHSLRNS